MAKKNKFIKKQAKQYQLLHFRAQKPNYGEWDPKGNPDKSAIFVQERSNSVSDE